MADLDEYVFGYASGNVDKEDVAKLGSAMLKLGVSSSLTSDGDFRIGERDRARLLSYTKNKISVELGETEGIYGFLKHVRERRGALLAILLVAWLFVLLQSLVWDVRVNGNETLSDSDIQSALGECGFSIGTVWHSVDNSLIEASVLASHPEIAWISLNRRGTVAYVEVLESENVGITEEVAPMYSNIVADRDGVIEEITVKQGAASVKIGDVVRAGDVLISGIIENERGVTLCRAEGIVRASSAKDVSAVVSQNVTEEIYKERFLADMRVIIFNFSINIFKNYRNYGNSCDIIEEIKEFALFGRYRLPISVKKVYVREYAQSTRILAEDEMIFEAKRTLDETLRSEFRDADVVKMKTTGEFSNSTYRLTTRVVYVTDIGKERAIEIS